MNCIVVDYKWEITENNCLSVPLVSKKQLIGKKWMKYLNAAIYCTDENIQSCKFAFLRKIQVSNERNIHADQCTFSWCTMFNDHFILGQKSYDHDILKLQKGHSIISNTKFTQRNETCLLKNGSRTGSTGLFVAAQWSVNYECSQICPILNMIK